MDPLVVIADPDPTRAAALAALVRQRHEIKARRLRRWEEFVECYGGGRLQTRPRLDLLILAWNFPPDARLTHWIDVVRTPGLFNIERIIALDPSPDWHGVGSANVERVRTLR